MTEYDRGAYTPHADAPLAFDPRSPRERRPIPMTLVASAAILVVLVGAVFMAYRHGLRGGTGAPRTIGAPVGAVKTIAPPEAAAKDSAAQLDVYAAQNVQATPAFAPPPETPAPRAAPERLQVQAATPPAAPIETIPAAASSGSSAATAVSRGAADRDAAASTPPAPAAAPTPARAKARSAALSVASDQAADATIDAALARSRAPAETAAPRAKSAGAVHGDREAAAAAAAPDVGRKAAPAVVRAERARQPTATAAEPRPAKATLASAEVKAAKPVAAHGKSLVQIGAFGSRAIAEAEFAKLSAIAGAHGKAVSAVTVGGKTLYRTALTGFADRAAASAFCAKLAAAGHACIVKG